MATILDALTFGSTEQQASQSFMDGVNWRYEGLSPEAKLADALLLQSLVDESQMQPVTPAQPTANPAMPAKEPTRNEKLAESTNKEFGSAGIKAFVDANGRMVYTNSAAATDAESAKAYFPADKATAGSASSPAGMPNTPGGLAGLFSQLQKAESFDSAVGVQTALTTAIAQERARLSEEAIRLSSVKVGVPQLEASLRMSEDRDRTLPGWQPYLGFSPNTENIRKQLGSAKAQADAEAKRWLTSNVTLASLSAMEENSKLILSNKQRTMERTEVAAEQRRLINEEKETRKKDVMRERAAVIDPAVRSRVALLAPQVFQNDTDGVNLITYLEQQKGNKALIQVLDAGDDDIPVMALNGNKFAEDLMVRMEAKNIGTDETIVRGSLDSLRRAMKNDPKFMETAMRKVFPSNAEGARARTEASSMRVQALAKGAEGRAELLRQEADLALQYMRATATETFLSQANTWQVADPEFRAAVTTAKEKMGGVADMRSVLAAYVGDKTGPEAFRRIEQFNRLAYAAANQRVNSMFGAPSIQALNTEIARAARGYSTIGSIQEVMRQAVPLRDIGNLAREANEKIFDFSRISDPLKIGPDGSVTER
jgi:hypothetical protein